MTATIPRPIIVWCHPRSCSTAFERAFIQRKDTSVLHEPLGDPFYFGKERACKRYNDEQCKERTPQVWDHTVEGALRKILEDAKSAKGEDGKALKFVFIKDMAQYIFPATLLHSLHPESTLYPPVAGHTPSKIDIFAPVTENPTEIPTSLLREFTHTFLIRTPEKSVPSYYKCAQEGASGFGGDWCGAESGYYELVMLHSYISNPSSTFNQTGGSSPTPTFRQPQPPPLLSASDLLHDPHSAVKAFCEAVGVPFDPDMLSWKSEQVKEFAKWDGFHRDAEQSTGFRKESGDSDNATDTPDVKSKPKKELPENVQQTIRANMPAFDYLYARRTIHTNADDAQKASTNDTH